LNLPAIVGWGHVLERVKFEEMKVERDNKNLRKRKETEKAYM